MIMILLLLLMWNDINNDINDNINDNNINVILMKVILM